MLKVEHSEVVGWKHAIRGMRNPLNSWDKSDTGWISGNEFDCDRDVLDTEVYEDVDGFNTDIYVIGPNDLSLMKKLRKAGPDHGKFMRMITVYCDITAPLYWWKEYDTYKVGTVANSCSTMHKIAEKEFTLDDFSCEHLLNDWNAEDEYDGIETAESHFQKTVYMLNFYRNKYLETKDKKYWWQMIQLLPSSYNQKRTVMLNYEVLANMYHARKNHKLDEWHALCDWIKSLPYSELITGEE